MARAHHRPRTKAGNEQQQVELLRLSAATGQIVAGQYGRDDARTEDERQPEERVGVDDDERRYLPRRDQRSNWQAYHHG